MDNKGFSDEAKNKIGGKSKSFSKYLTNAEFSFPLAKSPQCNVSMSRYYRVRVTSSSTTNALQCCMLSSELQKVWEKELTKL